MPCMKTLADNIPMHEKRQSLRVLYLHPAAAFGGASKSLIELFCSFPEQQVQATVLCPSGQAAEQFRKAGMQVIECVGLSQWDNTRFGYYRGKRWLILLRELMLWPLTYSKLLSVSRHGRFDLIHANEITLLPTAIYAQRILKAPLVIHVRSLQRLPNSSPVTNWVNGMLAMAQAVIAIDRTVARALPEHLDAVVIHNGIRLTESMKAMPRSMERPMHVAMVGGLLRMKGVYEFVEAAKICRDRGLNIKFLLAGENPRNLKGISKWALEWLGLAHDVRSDLEQYIKQNNLGGMVKLLGFVSDVNAFYKEIDLLCFPSHLDAAGRPVFEAAFHGVPALVAAENPEPDTVIDGETGLCIAPRNPAAIADALEYLSDNRGRLALLGENARRLAMEYFDNAQNAKQVLELYRHAITTFSSNVA